MAKPTKEELEYLLHGCHTHMLSVANQFHSKCTNCDMYYRELPIGSKYQYANGTGYVFTKSLERNYPKT